MRAKIVCVGCFLLLLLADVVVAEALRALESQVLRLADLQRAEWSARQDWQSQRQLLQDQLAMLHKHGAMLDAALAEQRQESAEIAAGNAAVATELAALLARLGELRTALLAQNDALLVLQRRLPPVLQRQLQDVFTRLGRLTEKEPDLAALPGILQAQLSVLTEVEQYDHGIHLAKEVLPDDGGQRCEYDVMYFGLAVAYALSANGARAGMGVPGADGWEWRWRDEWIPVIAQAMAVARKEQPAQLLRLPLPPIAAEPQP
ncbi:MAG: DUF3450 domain-containing protein [Lentisphaerae bacterium]|nr:DUF3450 domain-containing protein [Lentisphaerota bacterium]